RRHGGGAELLARREAYLAGQGAKTLFDGPMPPCNPFYFGLYGGSDLPGFPDSAPSTRPFLCRHGYQVHATSLVFQRSLTQALTVPDIRFPPLRQKYDVRIVPRSGVRSWWQECTLGPVELVEFHLQD